MPRIRVTAATSPRMTGVRCSGREKCQGRTVKAVEKIRSAASGNTMEALPACVLRDVAQEALGVAVIGIDEGQFFPDIVEFSETMANAGKTVIVAALDGTFQRKAFGTILNLVPLAESVVKLTAVCMECFREAAYTKRLGVEKEVEVIGGADKYHSVCRLCYFKKASGQPVGLDSKENKENCPVLGKPGEAMGARKLFAPHQILQCSPAN
ncbi:thymidine kinase, cytosolic isoform X2 [Lagenorhynchus albirostris]|uniref:thymidine kinase, cytosolic isoform X2 n=1 Tax=Lagenorhynchus albirostris TaxID=27610 RepID=UPI0028E753CA|nr:thymidine kinase, cytosolic isoform X2 [Lagenorhynchus albirostris]